MDVCVKILLIKFSGKKLGNPIVTAGTAFYFLVLNLRRVEIEEILEGKLGC